MNCCWLILLLLFCGGNNNQMGCGCRESARPKPSCSRPEPSCGRQEQESCPCDDNRFEPRFEQRPFSGNGSTCGCEGEGN